MIILFVNQFIYSQRRIEHAAAVDIVSDRIILFGGPQSTDTGEIVKGVYLREAFPDQKCSFKRGVWVKPMFKHCQGTTDPGY